MEASTAIYVGPWDCAPAEPPLEPPRPRWPGSAGRSRLRVLAFLVVTLVVGLLLAQVPAGSLIFYAELTGRGMAWVDTEVLDPVAMPPLTLLMVNLTLASLA